MRQWLSSETFSRPMQKIALYYLGYCAILILTQISMVSVVAFFHFLLDHDMSVVENWLTRNAWEMLCLSKLVALFAIMNVIRLNLYTDTTVIHYLKKLEFKPDHQVIVFIFFVLAADLMLVLNSPLSYTLRELEFSATVTSFFGSATFYFLDMILIVYLMELFPILKKRNKIILLTFFTIIFLIVTNIIHPYSKVNTLYMVLFYSSLVITLFLFPKNMGNLIWLSSSFIGLSCIIFGQDLVWSNSYSLIIQNRILPPIGHLACWFIGVIYLVKSVKLEAGITVS